MTALSIGFSLRQLYSEREIETMRNVHAIRATSCPKCGSPAGQQCRSKRGTQATRTHKDRLAQVKFTSEEKP